MVFNCFHFPRTDSLATPMLQSMFHLTAIFSWQFPRKIRFNLHTSLADLKAVCYMDHFPFSAPPPNIFCEIKDPPLHNIVQRAFRCCTKCILLLFYKLSY